MSPGIASASADSFYPRGSGDSRSASVVSFFPACPWALELGYLQHLKVLRFGLVSLTRIHDLFSSLTGGYLQFIFRRDSGFQLEISIVAIVLR